MTAISPKIIAVIFFIMNKSGGKSPLKFGVFKNFRKIKYCFKNIYLLFTLRFEAMPNPETNAVKIIIKPLKPSIAPPPPKVGVL